MKKLYIITFLTFLGLNVYSQTLHNTFMAGGSGNFSQDEIFTEIDYTPKIGYFFLKNLATGISLDGEYYKASISKRSNLTLAPFFRYYFSENKLRPFAEINYGWYLAQNNSTGNTLTENHERIQGILGINYFLLDIVALELNGSYTYYAEKYQSVGLRNSVGLEFGALFFFDL